MTRLLHHQRYDGTFAADAAAGGLRSDSWKSFAAAEDERFDAAEAQGYGVYSLHAVLGQGSFGRIHLVSWQRGVDVSAVSRSLQGLNVADDDGGGRPTLPTTGCPGSFGEGSLSALAAELQGALGGGAPEGWRGKRAASQEWHHSVSPSARHRRGCRSSGSVDVPPYASEEEEGSSGEVGLQRPRLRALKSVCKRKVTEKGLVRHMETVSGRSGVGSRGCCFA